MTKKKTKKKLHIYLSPAKRFIKFSFHWSTHMMRHLAQTQLFIKL